MNRTKRMAFGRFHKAAMFWLLLVSVATIGHTQCGCELLATSGLVDTSATISDTELATSYRRWFCDQRFAEQESSESFSIKALAPFKGIPVQLGFDKSADDWSTWSAEICSDERKDTWMRDIFVQNLRTVNVELAKVLKECITEDKGLHVWLERTSDSKFKVAMSFDSPVRILRSVSVIVKPDKDVNCDPPLKITLNSPGEKRLLCRRTFRPDGSADASQLIVNSDDIVAKGGGKLVLPAIYIPPPLPPCSDQDRAGYLTSISNHGSAVPQVPEIFAHFAPRSANPPTLYWLEITAAGHVYPKCQNQETLSFTQTDTCRFILRGRRWTAKLSAVDPAGQGADVRFAPECP
jgi:hypothetical protein